MAKKKTQTQEEDGFSVPEPMMFVRYDSATINEANRDMFLHCDGRSADASALPMVRARSREFARKEVANNSYARGLTLIVAGDMVGRGPRLQIEENISGINEVIERHFNEWADEIQLSSKLQTAKIAKMVDGETFGVFYRDNKLKSCHLNFKFIECDRVAAPYGAKDTTDELDGIVVDEYGDPVSYYILTEHPGSSQSSFRPNDYSKYSADSVVHWFRQDRNEQHRGVTEFMPALPLFFMLRRYTLATVEAAEAAANFPLVLYTDSPAVPAVRANKRPFASFPLERGKMTSLPEGWELSQVHPEQPVTNYPDFKRELLAEVARCFSVPVNVISGDSSKHNYASGRLDFQTYHKSLDVERKSCETQVLNKVFQRWFEQNYIFGARPGAWIATRPPKVSWFWDGFPHVDPVKEANAQAIRLRNLTSSYADECARRGQDWKVTLEQIAEERKYMKELGLVID